jgi:hypothetical protein
MDRARTFFFVSAGLFLLAVAYHLGATSATAQSAIVEGATVNQNGYFAAASGRTFYWGYAYYSGGSPPLLRALPDPIPGTSEVVVAEVGSDGYNVVLANGDTYVWGWGGARSLAICVQLGGRPDSRSVRDLGTGEGGAPLGEREEPTRVRDAT